MDGGKKTIILISVIFSSSSSFFFPLLFAVGWIILAADGSDLKARVYGVLFGLVVRLASSGWVIANFFLLLLLCPLEGRHDGLH